MKEWITCDLSGLDLLVIQIDGIHMDEDLILVAAIGVDAIRRTLAGYPLTARLYRRTGSP